MKIKVLIILVIVFIVIQFIPVERTNPTSKPEDEIVVAGEIKQILERSCYDCHSNNTEWPTYSSVAPVSWLIASHVDDARKDMNFTEWNTYPERKKFKLREEMIEELEDEGMPLPPYLILHSEAELSVADMQVLLTWLKESSNN